MQDVLQWEGKTVVDSQGRKIGTIDDVYFDEQTGQPEWALVKTGAFGLKHSFMPLTESQQTGGDTISVRWDEDTVKSAPKIDNDQELSSQEEQELASYYGLQYSHEQSKTGLPAGGGQPQGRAQQPPRGEQDTAMTRSEEELRIGKTRRPSELVRLRKYVVTEIVQQTVPVTHEEVRVEREPITEANRDKAMSGPDIRENVHEETLYTEEPVVEKRVVPKERVHLEKEQTTEEEQVSEQVRKERLEVERGKAGEGRGGGGKSGY
jgi:uncharacterized protein (TIGR02271 family)